MDKEEYVRWEKTSALFSAVRKQACRTYSIPLVPDELRKWNENAYMPKVVSIGPRYKGRRDLLPMEEIKWHCIMSLLSRAASDSDRVHREASEMGDIVSIPRNEDDFLRECIEAVIQLDEVVRASYVDEIKLDRYDLATTMVFDGCFLLELLICESELDSQRPIPTYGTSPAKEVKKMEYVLSDMMLLENQIPTVILDTLFCRVFENLRKSSEEAGAIIQGRALFLFGFSGYSMNQRFFDAFHFLDLGYLYIKMKWPESEIEENEERRHQHASTVIDVSGEENIQRPDVQHLKRCATRLEAVGITIKRLNNHNSSAPFGFFEFFKFNVKFNDSAGMLEIPSLNITQTTEALWRNFIALEHHRNKLVASQLSSSTTDTARCYIFTSSALFFSDLICCTSDVQLLKDREVIVDHLGNNNRDLVAFFHSIAGGVDRGIIDPLYGSMFNALNTYSKTNYATKVFILLCHYFCRILNWCYNVLNFFRRGYTFAATIVTILTAVQTCYAIVAYHFPKN